ncbi:hypothetical protein K0A97_01210 [Patescibacteria group bacterium]|nr:hypothetical protein [Patescibacteria group bacterium]
MVKENKKRGLDKTIYSIVMFALIFALFISFVFTIERLFLERPEDNCSFGDYPYFKDYSTPYVQTSSLEELNCSYDEGFITECLQNEGNLIYKKDCEVECSYCYRDFLSEIKSYNNRINLGRMIFTFIFALTLAFIKISDKIIKYSLLSASLVSLLITTIMALEFLGRTMPLIILTEFLLVIFIYKKTNNLEKN